MDAAAPEEACGAAVAEAPCKDACSAAVADAPGKTLEGLQDEELLEELRRRGLLASYTGLEVPSAPVAGGPGEPAHAQASTEAHQAVFQLARGPRGGPLAPQLLSGPSEGSRFKIQEIGALHGLEEYAWELQEGSCAGVVADGHPAKVARLSSSWLPGAFGRKCVHVHGLHGKEVFKLLQSASTWNPSQLRWSYRILPPGSEHSSDALFTVNRDLLGKGPLGLREQWRVFKGRAREGEVVYYCIANALAWEYHVYRNEEDHGEGRDCVAHLKKVHGTGTLSEETNVWIPAEFELEVKPGEDAALLLSVATVQDLAHERSHPASSI